MYGLCHALRKGKSLDETGRLDIYSEALADIRAICQLAESGTNLECIGHLAHIKRIVTETVEEALYGTGV